MRGGAESSAAGEECSSNPGGGGAAILWFKHDLRIDDHPGLVAAASRYRTVIPLYVFDHRILSRQLLLSLPLFFHLSKFYLISNFSSNSKGTQY